MLHLLILTFLYDLALFALEIKWKNYLIIYDWKILCQYFSNARTIVMLSPILASFRQGEAQAYIGEESFIISHIIESER